MKFFITAKVSIEKSDLRDAFAFATLGEASGAKLIAELTITARFEVEAFTEMQAKIQFGKKHKVLELIGISTDGTPTLSDKRTRNKHKTITTFHARVVGEKEAQQKKTKPKKRKPHCSECLGDLAPRSFEVLGVPAIIKVCTDSRCKFYLKYPHQQPV